VGTSGKRGQWGRQSSGRGEGLPSWKGTFVRGGISGTRGRQGRESSGRRECEPRGGTAAAACTEGRTGSSRCVGEGRGRGESSDRQRSAPRGGAAVATAEDREGGERLPTRREARAWAAAHGWAAAREGRRPARG
jgi:hypothetical protein